MKNKNVFFAGLLCAGSVMSLQADNMTNSDMMAGVKTSVEVSQGYRRDDLKLKFSDGKQNFKKIDTYTTRLGVKLEKDDCFMKAIVGYGNVYDGKVSHNGNGHGHNKVKGDYTADFIFNVGKYFFMDNGWTVTPSLGYSVYVQDFHTKHGHNGQGKQRLKAVWYSPQVGVCAKKTFSSEWNAYVNYNFLFPVNFQGTTHNKGNSNHRKQENQAYKSYGSVASIGAEYAFAPNWSLKPEIEGMYFYSKGGHNFKHARRSAVEYRLVLNYAF